MPHKLDVPETAAVYIALNLLVLLVLSVVVVAARVRHKVIMGDGGNPEVLRAIRAHANAAEYVPAGALGLLALALMTPETGAGQATLGLLVHLGGGALLAGRVLHGIGLNASERNLGRGLGALLTWIAFLVIIGGILWATLSANRAV